MSYTPTQWSAGDTVTSAKLNKMEQGIANAGGANILVAHVIFKENGEELIPTLDKTAREILNADFIFVKAEIADEIRYNYIDQIIHNEGYIFSVYDAMDLYAETENDYPTLYTQEDDDGDTPIPD